MEKEKYYGIYINNKIPKKKENEKNYINKYDGNIKLEFEGKAYIIEKDKEKNKNREKIKEELKNNSKFKKEGKYIIQLINDKKEIYYIDIEIEKTDYLLFLILLLSIFLFGMIFIANKNYIEKSYIIDEYANFDVELEGLKYVFDINYENTNFKSVSLTDKVSKRTIIYPGASGYFYVQISTKNGNKDMLYKMEVQDEINKPKNLKFSLYGKNYNSMKELSNAVNGTIVKDSNQIIRIDWNWDYETNDDYIDTNDGIETKTYNFLMRMTGAEKI